MPKRARILTVKEVERLGNGTHAVGGVDGLALRRDGQQSSWVLKITINGRRRQMGLGSAHDVSLNDARTKAAEIRADVRNGIDPVEARAQQKEKARENDKPVMTFAVAADEYIRLLQKSWTNEKHTRQWPQTINDYANPVIGDMPINEVETRHVIQILEPIFYSKTETAKRVRARMEKIFAWAIFNGHREKANPAIWRGHLDNVFLNPPKATAHFPALPYAQMPQFMAELRQRQLISARALEFIILTAARAKEATCGANQTVFATWDQIDLNDGVWTRPAALMKIGVEHRVPLSDDAIALLEALPHRTGLLFSRADGRKPIVTDSMIRLIHRLHEQQVGMGNAGFVDPAQGNAIVTTHGFRSSFRDWASETTQYPNELIEMAMAHTIENKVERAYRRGDMLERRRDLMNDWARYCRGK